MAIYHPDEKHISSVIRTNIIGMNMINIAIIDYEIDLNQLLTMTYNMILTGFDNIVHIIKNIKNIPDKIKKQFIGVYCNSDIDQHLALLINIDIKCGMTNEYKTLEKFVQSFYINAVIWRHYDLIPKLHIILQIWKQTNEERLKELQVAIYKNAINPYIYKIHIFVEEEGSLLMLNTIPAQYLSKIQFFSLNNTRLTYKAALDYIRQLPILDYAAIINTDIYFDETISNLWNTAMDNTCLALLRHEATIAYAMGEPNAELPQPFGEKDCNCSQDAWIFRVKDVIEDKQKYPDWSNYNFNLGEVGCDNTILSELVNHGWNISNPAYSIKIYHLHNSNFRTYQFKNRINHGVYTFITPSYLIEQPKLA